MDNVEMINEQLCQRIDELEHEKLENLRQIDALEAELAEVKRQLSTMRGA